jgi:hypothetical protein
MPFGEGLVEHAAAVYSYLLVKPLGVGRNVASSAVGSNELQTLDVLLLVIINQ